jgi:hypothetical protein
MPVQIGVKSSTVTNPAGLMSDSHRRIQIFMKAISAAAGFEGRWLNDDERQSLDAALRYVREAAPRHNGDEEKSLFPRLRLLPELEVGRALADLASLEQEHHWAAPLHRRFLSRQRPSIKQSGACGRSVCCMTTPQFPTRIEAGLNRQHFVVAVPGISPF